MQTVATASKLREAELYSAFTREQLYALLVAAIRGAPIKKGTNNTLIQVFKKRNDTNEPLVTHRRRFNVMFPQRRIAKI